MKNLKHKRFSYISYIAKTLALTVMMFSPQSSIAKEQYRYEPGKLVEQKAELYCQSLANMSLGMQETVSISVHTKPKFVGTSHNGKKVIAVSYPYRRDGITFACIFYDYTNGLLQLLEFGHAGKNVDDITKVKLLY